MELVPILSTIILVGTIATFILAVFAYILYKVRERRTREAGPQRQYVEARRQQQQVGGGRQTGPALGHASQASMYIAPTSTLPPQGPVVEVDNVHEAAPLAGGWSQPPRLERAVAAPQPYDHEGDGRRSQRIARQQPAYETAEAALPRRRLEESREPSSLFWEYTDEGFVPVDPTKAPARGEQRRERHAPEEDEGSAWL